MHSIRRHRPKHGIKDLCLKNQLNEALQLARNLAHEGEPLHTHDFYCLLKSCIRNRDLFAGRQVHSLIKASCLDSNSFLGSHLIRLYDSCESMSEANDVFDRVLEPDVFTWSTIISAHAKLGEAEEALELFRRMQLSGVQPDKYVFVALLKACSNGLAPNQGILIHSYLMEGSLEADRFICSILIDMYSKCGSLNDARQVLNHMQNKDVVAWNAMILGYAEHGYGEEALMLFKQMQVEGVEANHASILSIVKACCVMKSLQNGMRLHASILQNGLSFGDSIDNALMDMYAKSGSLDSARRVFEEHSRQDVVAWNTMIAGYFQAGPVQDALAFFDRMCQGGVKANIMTWNTVIAGLMRYGLLKKALLLFSAMLEEDLVTDVITWNSLLSGLFCHGHIEEALRLFCVMLKTDLEPTVATFLVTLKACSEKASLCDGQNFHSYIIENKLESDVMIAGALVDMYANSRCLEHAFSVFDRVQGHNVFTWSALIAGLVQNNQYRRALEFFAIMQQEGCKPNEVTFVSVLSACCHAGLVDEGYSYFTLMHECYGIVPTLEHYNCLVELFGATGYLVEAEHMLLSMPFRHNIMGWTSLLSHCRNHTDIPIARHSLQRAFAIENRHAALYVMMSNIYNDAGMTEDAKVMLSMRMLLDSQHKVQMAYPLDIKCCVSNDGKAGK